MATESSRVRGVARPRAAIALLRPAPRGGRAAAALWYPSEWGADDRNTYRKSHYDPVTGPAALAT